MVWPVGLTGSWQASSQASSQATSSARPAGTLQAVIFDLDGVLVATDVHHYRAWKQLADELGLPFDHRTNDRMRGISRLASLDVMLQAANVQYSDAQKLELAQRKNRFYQSLIAELTPSDVLPGVRALMSYFKSQRLAAAVVSASRNARTILEKLQLTDQFQVIVDGDDVTQSKPDPQGFLIAAEQLGVAPMSCLVLEDADTGVQAAQAAGMMCMKVLPPAQASHAAADTPADTRASA